MTRSNDALDLRTAIAEAIYMEGVTRDGPESKPITWEDCANVVMTVLGDPTRRLSILEAMNVDAEEMLVCSNYGDHMPHLMRKGQGRCHDCESVLLVRPRESS